MTRGRKPQKRSLLAARRLSTAREIFGLSYEGLVSDSRWQELVNIFDVKTVQERVKQGVPKSRGSQIAEYFRVPPHMMLDNGVSDQLFERQVYDAKENVEGADRSHLRSSSRSTNLEYDAFILHVEEDTNEFVRRLSNAMKNLGLKVQHENCALKAGDSLMRGATRGLTACRTGLLICIALESVVFLG